MSAFFILLLEWAPEYGIIYILAAPQGRQLENFRFGGIIMATEAQTIANRSNAQKSTGPRTPEGKGVVAQNAVKHGLLARDVAIKGEDPGAFALYREGMLAKLRNLRRFREQDATDAVGSVPVRAYRGTGILPVVQNHGQDAHATEPPDGVITNVSEAESQLCETNPICGRNVARASCP